MMKEDSEKPKRQQDLVDILKAGENYHRFDKICELLSEITGLEKPQAITLIIKEGKIKEIGVFEDGIKTAIPEKVIYANGTLSFPAMADG